jgi:riboflavin synthase
VASRGDYNRFIVFTGLIQDMGTVRRVSGSSPKTLEITTILPADGFALGESIALNGVCLTVTERGPGVFSVQAGAETLAKTTVGSWAAGQRVHLERALALGDRLGGHLVLGHVDGTGRVTQSRSELGGWTLEIEAPPTVAPFLLPKGSIALEGVSLTVNAITGDKFSVFLIPETLKRTALPQLRPGDAVNLEADILGKYVARLLSRTVELPQVTLESLQAAGFA